MVSRVIFACKHHLVRHMLGAPHSRPPYFLRFFDAVVAFFDDAFLDVGPAGGA